MVRRSGVREVIAGHSCCGCGVCAAVCPAGAIVIAYDSVHGHQAALDEDLCTGCGLCDSVCPKAGSGIESVSESTVPFLLGEVKLCTAGVASDDGLRQRGASGGVVTAVALEALQQGVIDLLVSPALQAPELRMEHRIVTDPDELTANQGSNYLPGTLFPSIADALKTDGKIGIVGLPCQIRAVQNARAVMPKWRERIVLMLGLLCNSQPSEQLSRLFLERMRVDTQGMAALRYRIGHWRGRFRLICNDGTVQEWPFQEFSRYWAFFRCQGCYSCADLTAELADISFGDIWHPAWRSVQEKHTAILVRTDRGEKIWDVVRQEGLVRERPLSTTELIQGQRVALPWKKRTLAARATLWKRFGWTFAAGRTLKPRFVDYVSACIDWLSHRTGRSKIGRWLLAKGNPKIVAFYVRIANVHAISRIRDHEE